MSVYTCFNLFLFIAIRFLPLYTIFVVILVAAHEQNAGKSRMAPKMAQTEPVKISLKDCLACR